MIFYLFDVVSFQGINTNHNHVCAQMHWNNHVSAQHLITEIVSVHGVSRNENTAHGFITIKTGAESFVAKIRSPQSSMQHPSLRRNSHQSRFVCVCVCVSHYNSHFLTGTLSNA